MRLDRYMEHAGLLIRNVFDLDFALQLRMRVPYDSMNYYEFLLLRILAEEKNKHQMEEMKKNQSG